MSQLSEIKAKIKDLRTEAYKLKTKQAKQKRWDKVRELKREALDILYTASKRHGTQSVKAIVKTFNSGNDRFLVETPYGNMWVSPCNDVLAKSWYPHTCCIEYTVGQEIILEIETEVNSQDLFLQIHPSYMRGGRVNETQYAELCKRDDLAFFKYPQGMTGLFK